jgi:hypothetical protein
MSVSMESFTPLTAALGGGLFWLGNGRIAGIRRVADAK